MSQYRQDSVVVGSTTPTYTTGVVPTSTYTTTQGITRANTTPTYPSIVAPTPTTTILGEHVLPTTTIRNSTGYPPTTIPSTLVHSPSRVSVVGGHSIIGGHSIVGGLTGLENSPFGNQQLAGSFNMSPVHQPSGSLQRLVTNPGAIIHHPAHNYVKPHNFACSAVGNDVPLSFGKYTVQPVCDPYVPKGPLNFVHPQSTIPFGMQAYYNHQHTPTYVVHPHIYSHEGELLNKEVFEEADAHTKLLEDQEAERRAAHVSPSSDSSSSSTSSTSSSSTSHSGSEEGPQTTSASCDYSSSTHIRNHSSKKGTSGSKKASKSSKSDVPSNKFGSSKYGSGEFGSGKLGSSTKVGSSKSVHSTVVSQGGKGQDVLASSLDRSASNRTVPTSVSQKTATSTSKQDNVTSDGHNYKSSYSINNTSASYAPKKKSSNKHLEASSVTVTPAEENFHVHSNNQTSSIGPRSNTLESPRSNKHASSNNRDVSQQSTSGHIQTSYKAKSVPVASYYQSAVAPAGHHVRKSSFILQNQEGILPEGQSYSAAVPRYVNDPHHIGGVGSNTHHARNSQLAMVQPLPNYTNDPTNIVSPKIIPRGSPIQNYVENSPAQGIVIHPNVVRDTSTMAIPAKLEASFHAGEIIHL